MKAEQRRNEILNLLKNNETLSASVLAEKLFVSRQIIVGDIALLRAAGNLILATPRGYTLQHGEKGIKRQIACKHNAEDMKAELYAIVDNGCKVIDVTVDHPVYGQLCGMLQLSSRGDVNQFIEKCASAQPLSCLTGGVHLHTVFCRDAQAFEHIVNELKKLNILLPDN